jgi:integrase
MLTVLQMVLEDAMRQGWVVRNVAHLVDRVPQTKRKMQTFTEGEVRKLLKAAESDRLEAAWHLALSGLRRGEVCGLTWDDVDLEAGELNIRHTRTPTLLSGCGPTFTARTTHCVLRPPCST